MRRERITAFVAVTVVAIAAAVGMPGAASAATPQEICNALIANPNLNAQTTFSTADLAAYVAARASDPNIQGYCPPLVVLTISQQCVEAAPHAPGAVQAQNGKWFTNAPNGNAEACTTPPAPCMVVPAGTPGAQQAANGVWYANTPGGNAEACAPARAAAVVTVPTGGAQPTSGVKGATKVKTKPAARPQTAAAPAQRQAAPLAQTRQAGTLPFTGAQLGIFAIVGLALVGGGILLRLTGRQKRTGA
jgi:hypothetical protein